MGKEPFEDLVIFELANNHQGSIEHGCRVIELAGKAAQKYNIRAGMKLQYRDLDTFIHPKFINCTDVKHIPRFLSTRLSQEGFFQLVDCIRANGLIPICTPFDEKSVDLCVEHNIEILKIASCSANDWPLLEKVVAACKPVIVSTGGKTFADMDNIHNFFTHREANFAMLHCVGMYPVENSEVQLDILSRMKMRYHDICVGYSGHENPENMLITGMAIAKGAKILERHIGLATDKIKLNDYSTDVARLDGWLETIVSAREICGDSKRKLIPEKEIQSMNELARGCFAAQPIRKGDSITRSMVYFAMPCDKVQTTSGQFIDGMTAHRDYDANDVVTEARSSVAINSIRELIHEIKGMLYEAKIALGQDFQLELSHHFGMENFKEFGTSMISVVNREYCKKILIMLPGQQHPSHMHKIKEETFQVLHGDLSICVEDKTVQMKPGEILVVPRCAVHSFSSENGCIFEEISTRHVKDDSYYEDARISSLDLIQRKTILQQW